jgi:hypothetical protein
VVIGDFDVVGIALHHQRVNAIGFRVARRPGKADAVFVVDPDAVLSLAVASFELFVLWYDPPTTSR